jgi:cytochrome c
MEFKKVLSLVTIAVATMVFMSGFALAQEKMATPAQAKELDQKAVAFIKEVGCEKALAEFNNLKSHFNATYSNAYITTSDFNGNATSNGRYAYLVGKNLIDVKDAEGKPFLKNGLDALQKKGGKANLEYKWQDPKTKKIETRTLIGTMVDCGAPRGKLSVSVTYEGKI